MFAVDIDDTLAETALHLMERMREQFGHDLSPQDLRHTYHQPGLVPQWQTPHHQHVMAAWFNNRELLLNLKPVDQAQTVLSRLSAREAIVCYITSRQHELRETTQQWLATHAFPKAPLITRNEHERRVDWKIRLLRRDVPQVTHLIDDALTATPPVETKVRLVWLNRCHQAPESVPPGVIEVSSWAEIERLIG